MHCKECDVTMDDVPRKGGFHKQTKYECPNCHKKVFKENKKSNKASKGGKGGKGGFD